MVPRLAADGMTGHRALRGYRGRTETPPAKLSACATCHYPRRITHDHGAMRRDGDIAPYRHYTRVGCPAITRAHYPRALRRGGSPPLCSYPFIVRVFVFLCVLFRAPPPSSPPTARAAPPLPHPLPAVAHRPPAHKKTGRRNFRQPVSVRNPRFPYLSSNMEPRFSSSRRTVKTPPPVIREGRFSALYCPRGNDTPSIWSFRITASLSI